MVHSFNRELDRRLAPMELSPEVRHVMDAQRVKLAGAELSSTADERPRLALKQAIDESFVSGFPLVMLTSLGLALASAFLAFIVIENKTRQMTARAWSLRTELSYRLRSQAWSLPYITTPAPQSDKNNCL